MFEKEAENYHKNLVKKKRFPLFKDGAAYGYKLAHEEMDYLNRHWENGKDKANEWHDLRKNPNDLPKENMKQVIVIDSYDTYEMGWYCIHKGIWYCDECPDPDDEI